QCLTLRVVCIAIRVLEVVYGGLFRKKTCQVVPSISGCIKYLALNCHRLVDTQQSINCFNQENKNETSTRCFLYWGSICNRGLCISCKSGDCGVGTILR